MEDLNRQAEAIEGLNCAENKIQLQKNKLRRVTNVFDAKRKKLKRGCGKA